MFIDKIRTEKKIQFRSKENHPRFKQIEFCG
jgi:hypothetical protein